jgi:CheY-like chemotaxis protein
MPKKAPLSVLIVDDEEPVRKFVERVLRDAGYETAPAADGIEALERAQKIESLDLVVTDVNMPHMTGDELARRLQQTRPGLKVLYLTGYSDRLFKEKTTLWQDEAYLDKPCSVKGLLQAVSLLTHGRLETTKS